MKKPHVHAGARRFVRISALGLRLWIGCLFGISLHGVAGPLQTFTIEEHLDSEWSNELVHFPVSYRAWRMPTSLTLTDAKGQPLPSQVTGLKRQGLRVTGTAWTVVNLPAKARLTFELRPGNPTAGVLRLREEDGGYVLANEFLALRLPKLPGKLPRSAPLDSLPAPLLSVAAPDGPWLGQGAWVNADPPLQVTEATTSVIEEGAVRVIVRYRLAFADGRFYQADILLGERQECALFTDDTDVDTPPAAFRFFFRPGLEADRVYWRNNFYADRAKGLMSGPIEFGEEQVICRMRPWSFWWIKDLTTWAGFYKQGAEPFLGVIALRPSRWTPVGWDGFARTQIPITARPGGELDLTLALNAWTRAARPPPGSEDEVVERQMSAETLGTNGKVTPQHRELAFTLGTVERHVTPHGDQALLRRQLVRYSEFPLDEVKDYGFDFQRSRPQRRRPFLLFSQEDVDRARRQVPSVPSMHRDVTVATNYIARLGDLTGKIQQGPDGWKRFYRENYVHNGLFDHVPIAYVGSADERYGIYLAAGVKGMARAILDQFLGAPPRPTIGCNAHTGATPLLRLLLAYDAVADTGLLSDEEKRDIEAVLVFGAHASIHPDYWNTEVGLRSANPNMTSMLRLPLGLLALALEGHPRAAGWLEIAENELQRELRDWIAPGGAWIECPFYQRPSLDGMFMLSQALKNAAGRDYFADPRFQATMDYYGFLLTPPDPRFPPKQTEPGRALMTLPSIGDAMPGITSLYSGWIARATAQNDPAFSARQQFYWKGQGFRFLNGGRAVAFLMAACDPELPATPPTKLAGRFPGFGNILRTSWTDPRASYVAHRAGYFHHHYHQDYNSFVYHAKGAPLCVDFATRATTPRREPYYHNTVSFHLADSAQEWGLSGGGKADNVAAQEMISLPSSLDYSAGLSVGGGNQRVNRHLLLVKSDDPMGGAYLVLRDRTSDGQPNQEFFWNLWCLATGVETNGNIAHFPGQFGVDLDVHMLAPAVPRWRTDHWRWSADVYNWGAFSEEQYGVHVRKEGSAEDFFAVLHPRAQGQAGAEIVSMADAAAAQVEHSEGTDLVLLSPGKPVTVAAGEMSLKGEIAFARRYVGGGVRLAVLKGENATARRGDWGVISSGPCSIEIDGDVVTGESSGGAREVRILLPPNHPPVAVAGNEQVIATRRQGNELKLLLPEGAHQFTIQPK